MQQDFELLSLNLLRDMRDELGLSLNSLAGKQSKGLFDNYLGFSASHMNKAADGYIFLRESNRIDASKLLIRPSIESMIRIHSVRTSPELLFRTALTERKEDRKLARPVHVAAGTDYDAQDQKAWEEFKISYAAQFPNHRMEEKELNLREAARLAGIEGYYDRAYRIYCKFTHAALGATAGEINTDLLDNRTMAACVYAALDAAALIGGTTHQLTALRERLYCLDRTENN